MLSVLVVCIFFFFFTKEIARFRSVKWLSWGGSTNRCRVDSSSAQLAPELHVLALHCSSPPHAPHICVRVKQEGRVCLVQPQVQNWTSDDSVFCMYVWEKPYWLYEHWFWWLQVNVSQWVNEPIWNPWIMRTSCMMVGIQAFELRG